MDRTDVDLADQPGVIVTHALWSECRWRGITLGVTGENPRLVFVQWCFPQRFIGLAHPRDLIAL